MPKVRFVKDIKEGEQVKDLFLVSNKAVLVSNAGKPYINLALRDRTGQVECRVWDRAEEIAKRFDRDDIVEATGNAIQYQGRIQLKVNDVRRVEEEAELADYLPVTKRGIEPLWEELQRLVQGIQDPDLSRLLRRIFPNPPKTETARRFRQAPGGKRMHHDYIGGLLEHTVSVASICNFLSGHYEGVDADMLTAGALLHDIGKVGELSYEGAFDYTDEGRLLGHLVSPRQGDARKAYDPLPPRRARVRIPEASQDARGDPPALRREHGLEGQCLPRCDGRPAGGSDLDRLPADVREIPVRGKEKEVNGIPGEAGRKGGAGMIPRKAIFRITGLLVLFLALPLFAQKRAKPEKRNFLWEVRSETATAHLLGSIHLFKKEMYPLDREIEEAFHRSGVLVVEADLLAGEGGERQKRILQGALYPESDSLANHISKETRDLLTRMFPVLSLDSVSRLKPWALAMTLAVQEYQKMGWDYEYGIDVYFLKKAANGKQVREIEHPDFVIDMLNGFSDEHQDLFLQYTLLDLDGIEEKTDSIIRAWTAGDAAAMEKILSGIIHEHPRLLPMVDALLYKRNVNMAARIEEYLKEKGEFFVVVGAAHLVGEKGIVELLKKKGIPVEQQ
jgi:uncharacterized protein YbaP (TraB family)/23S rRNA maturation-related 3'-5' exoribonuclease YhaM